MKIFSAKRGAVFHWLIFIFFGAFGLLFILSGSLNFPLEVKGDWHLNFLHDTFYQAKIDLLELDQDARNFGKDTALQLASNGGFQSGSTCGTYENKQLWNRKETWCLENVKDLVSDLYKEHFLPTEFTEITFTDSNIAGKGGKKTIDSSQKYKQTYTYDHNFNVDIDYNFDEYAVLETDARNLVTACKNEADLETCLNSKPDYWELCDEDNSDRTVAFCVDSPLGVEVFYELALDFN